MMHGEHRRGQEPRALFQGIRDTPPVGIAGRDQFASATPAKTRRAESGVAKFAHCQPAQVGCILGPQLFHDMGAMALERPFADPQLVPDLERMAVAIEEEADALAEAVT